MTDRPPLDRESRVANLAIDPDVLARELEAEQVGDPLDEIDLDDPEQDALEAIRPVSYTHLTLPTINSV